MFLSASILLVLLSSGFVESESWALVGFCILAGVVSFLIAIEKGELS